MRCFHNCKKQPVCIIKHFWLGMSYMIEVLACEDCKNKILKGRNENQLNYYTEIYQGKKYEVIDCQRGW